MKKNKVTETSADGLSKVTGGFAFDDPSPFKHCKFQFTDDEVAKIKEKKGISLKAHETYTTGDLKGKGLIKGLFKNGSDLRKMLMDDFGFTITHF